LTHAERRERRSIGKCRIGARIIARSIGASLARRRAVDTDPALGAAAALRANAGIALEIVEPEEEPARRGRRDGHEEKDASLAHDAPRS
jgi:hypothetical protein